MLKKISILSNYILKPRSYGNEIIMFLGHNLKKFSTLPKIVKICVFNEDWVTNDDLKDFLAFNESQAGLLDTIFEIHNDEHMTLTEFYKFLIKTSEPLSKERKKLNKFELVEEELNGFYKVEIKIEPKYAIMKKTKEELILECPECGMISYKERLRS